MTRQPSSYVAPNWEDYERGHSPRQGSVGSETSHVHFDEESPSAFSDRLEIPRQTGSNGNSGGELRRRRSSFSLHVSSFAHLGGLNSLEAFARSWQRAAGFNEITSNHTFFLVGDEAEDAVTHHRSSDRPPLVQQKSLLREQLEREGTSSQAVIDDETTPLRPEDEVIRQPRKPSIASDRRTSDLLDNAPYLASPFASSYGGIHGSLGSRINSTSMRHAGRLYREQQATGGQDPDKEHEHLLVKAVEREDGQVVHVVVGQSTLPQTVFNSVNVLIGVGILSLPLAMKYSGWLIGLLFYFFAAIATRYTAGILAKCLSIDHSLVTFADLAYVSFGSKARIAVSIIFSVELLATCVALVVLFADSLDALIPGWGIVEWKILCGAILVPLSFVPLRFLSFTSFLGIICCLGIVVLVFVDGLLKPYTPGSLREPAVTHLFPASWSTLPLSFGLLMSPWGGHSVFPNIYKDMRHPKKYPKAMNYTYGFTYLLDLSMAVVGLLMFGDGIRDEVTSNILKTKGYPEALSVCIVVFISIVPLTKVPLNVRPIFVTIEVYSGLHVRTIPPSSGLLGSSGYTRGLLKGAIRTTLIIIIVVMAVLVPAFDIIMGLLGSAMCFSICIILPLAFHLKLFGKEIGKQERMLNWALIIVCSVMAIIGTVWVFLPRHVTGAR